MALTAALAGYVMVKFYGVIFLGQPREPSSMKAHDANWLESVGLAWLALGCVLIGVFPQVALDTVVAVTRALVGTEIRRGPAPWWIAPVAQAQASYSGLWLLSGMAGVTVGDVCPGAADVPRAYAPHAAVELRLPRPDRAHAGYRRRIWSADPGTCSGHSFASRAKYLRRMTVRPATAFISTTDSGMGLYLPLARAVGWLADTLSVLQRGRLAVYLLYSF